MPELYYGLMKQLFTKFNDMVERANHIEDVSIKRGDIVLNNDENDNGNMKDRSKPWNKNKYVVNDGVLDDPKTKEFSFHLSNTIYVSNQQETSNTQSFDKAKIPSRPKHTNISMVDLFELVFKTFITNKVITLPNNT